MNVALVAALLQLAVSLALLAWSIAAYREARRHEQALVDLQSEYPKSDTELK